MSDQNRSCGIAIIAFLVLLALIVTQTRRYTDSSGSTSYSANVFYYNGMNMRRTADFLVTCPLGSVVDLNGTDVRFCDCEGEYAHEPGVR